MKKFIKGVRFAPKNYSDEVEAKIQHYKKEGYKLPSRHLLRTEEQLAGIRESAKSTPRCWIIFPQTSAKECPLRKLTTWSMSLQRIMMQYLPLSCTKVSPKVYVQVSMTWYVMASQARKSSCVAEIL